MKLNRKQVLVGWLVVFWLTSITRPFRHISTWKQEITNLWKFKWRGGESNPGPLSPQAKSLTTRPPLLRKQVLNVVYQDLTLMLANSNRVHNIRPKILCYNQYSIPCHSLMNVAIPLQVTFYPAQPQGHVMSVKCEEPTDEPKVQVITQTWNIALCKRDGITDRQTDGRSDY